MPSEEVQEASVGEGGGKEEGRKCREERMTVCM